MRDSYGILQAGEEMRARFFFVVKREPGLVGGGKNGCRPSDLLVDDLLLFVLLG
ncbi:hypothetical protein J2129_001672 [Methanofollis sp. W23]|nr:hypothetical protein [Methanofollis sp. W23]